MSTSRNRSKLSAVNAMEEATRWLDRNRVNFEQLTAHHLKMGPINFWPVTGTITVDGEAGKRKMGGLAGLEVTLINECLIKRQGS